MTGDEVIAAACHQQGGPILSVRLKRRGPVVDGKQTTCLDLSIDLAKTIVRRTSFEEYRPADGAAKAKWHTAHASNLKLTMTDARAIRRLYANGETQDGLASTFHVSAWTIKKVVAGELWAEVE